MTLDEILNLPPLTETDIQRIGKATANPDEELKKFKPVKETHPDLYKKTHK